MIIMLTERGSRVIERQTHTYHTSMDGRGRDFRARFTFRSTVPSSSRPSVRSPKRRTDDGRRRRRAEKEGRKEGRAVRSFLRSLRCLLAAATCLCRCLRPSAPPSHCLSPHWHLSPSLSLSPSPSPVWFSARMFEFTRKWAWQPASHVASVVTRFNSYPMNYRYNFSFVGKCHSKVR